MKKIYFILLFISQLYATEHIILPLSKTLPVLKNIEKYAIIIKGGEQNMYIFVDPFCHYSQDFIKNITDPSNKLIKTYTYKIFLLKLNKFASMPTIKYILNSKDRLDTLKRFMVEKEKIKLDSAKINEEVDKIIQDVKIVGDKLDIYKRPYLIIEYKGWENDEDDFGDFDDDDEDEE